MKLTPSEQNALDILDILLTRNRGVCLSGVSRKKIMRRYAERFESCEYKQITYRDVFKQEFRSGMDLSLSFQKILSELDKNPNLKLVCINDIDLLISTTSYNFKLGALTNRVWFDFIKSLHTKFVIICNKNSALELTSKDIWFHHVETSDKDRIFVLKEILGDIIDYKELLVYVKSSSIDVIKKVSKQLRTYYEYEKDINVVEEFKKLLFSLDSSALDVKKTVEKPDFDLDIVGMNDIIEELRREIIYPIKLGCKDVPICKGMLLYGPPGTGKSTMGRWLSHELQGRFYLPRTTQTESLISNFSRMLKVACSNAPSVVFLDDFESILSSPSALRELLVLLDGIDTNGRKNVCIIATCANLTNIPEDLIRGSRLEYCIEFKHPTLDIIAKIILNRFVGFKDSENDILKTLSELTENDATELAKYMINWSHSNIRSAIDSVIRKIVYIHNDKTQVKGIKELNRLFKDETYRIDKHTKRSLRRIDTTKADDSRLYN